MIPFVGPSYQLAVRTADVQRAVNMRPVPIESNGQFMLQENPGLVQVADLGAVGRSAHSINGRNFFVAGSTLYEVESDGTATSRGTLSSSIGPVDIQSNSVELFMVDGVMGYTLNFSTNTFTTIPGMLGMAGSVRCAYLDQYAIYAPPGNSFYWSALANAGSVDPLSFSSAEAAPDNLVAHIVVNRQLYLLGSKTGEIWLNTGASVDAPFQRYDGTVMSVGCIAPYSLQECNGVPVWVGSSKDGAGSVWMADGYTPKRISNRAVEELLSTSTDLASATAYCWSWKGSVMYCLKAPGLETTLAFDFLTQSWHDQAELIDGAFSQHKVVAACADGNTVYVIDDDGIVCRYSDSSYSFNGRTKVRDRVSPHDATKGGRKLFGQAELSVDTGVTGSAMLRYSDDGGATWKDWRTKSLGELGKQKQRLLWNRLGSARDRVWNVRCTDEVPFSIVDFTVT